MKARKPKKSIQIFFKGNAEPWKQGWLKELIFRGKLRILSHIFPERSQAKNFSLARHRAAAGVQHTGKGVGDLIWLRVTKLEAEELNAWLVYTSKYLSGSGATQGGRLKSQAENHKREKHNFMQTHTVMKDKDLLRVEALQQMGGEGWKLWRELLFEGTMANSGHDYKLRIQAWSLAWSHVWRVREIRETGRGFGGWSGTQEKLKTNTAHGFETLVLNICDECRYQDWGDWLKS